MKKVYDVIISGAGPSGSLLGYLLSTKNIDTLVLEKEKFPRYKICAGGIQRKALQLLPYDIKETIEREIYGIYFSRRLKDIFYKEYSEPLMYTVDRIKLDDFMVQKSISSGCNVNFNEKVKNFEISGNEVKVFTEKNTYLSKILIGADGAGSIVSKNFNKNRKMQKIIGYETEIKSEYSDYYCLNDRSVMLDFGGIKKGYLWVFPKKNYLSIGDGGPVKNALNIKKYLLWFLKNSPFVLTKFDIKAHLIPVRTANTFLCDFRVLTLGDAAGLGDGFTGEGLYNAMLSSNIAYESIVNAFSNSNYNFRDYLEKINDKIYENIRKSLIISKIFFSSPLFYYKLIKNNDNLFNSCARILRGEKTYGEVVNKLKLIKI